MKTLKTISTIFIVAALLASCGGKKDKKGMQNGDETPLVQVQSVLQETASSQSSLTLVAEFRQAKLWSFSTM